MLSSSKNRTTQGRGKNAMGTTTEDSNSELLPAEEQAYIRGFSKRIIRERSGNFRPLKRPRSGDYIYPDIAGLQTNRGNKLLQGSECVTRGRLGSGDIAEDTVFYNGSEHRLLQRLHLRMKLKRAFLESRGDAGNNNDSDTSDKYEGYEEDLNSLVDFKELLTPISSLGDIVKRPSVFRTFNNKILRDLSLQMVLMVEKEQNSVIRFSRILEVLLGDYPKPLLEEALKLKDYDHNLILPTEEQESKNDEEVTDKPQQVEAEEGIGQERPEQESKNEKGSTDTDRAVDPTTDTSGHNNPDNTDKSHTQSEGEEAKQKEDTSDSESEGDPFFALPGIERMDGLRLLFNDITSPEVVEQMEITRQMVQIGLQRNQEFIRNLQKARNIMDRANRVRERILAWSKEFIGIPEEDVTTPNVLRAAKRGLISATTNRTMVFEDGDDEQREEAEKENGTDKQQEGG